MKVPNLFLWNVSPTPNIEKVIIKDKFCIRAVPFKMVWGWGTGTFLTPTSPALIPWCPPSPTNTQFYIVFRRTPLSTTFNFFWTPSPTIFLSSFWKISSPSPIRWFLLLFCTEIEAELFVISILGSRPIALYRKNIFPLFF